MEFIKSNQNISLGADYFVWFGDKRLTLDKGVMRKGGVLPPSTNLVNTSLEIVPFKLGRKNYPNGYFSRYTCLRVASKIFKS